MTSTSSRVYGELSKRRKGAEYTDIELEEQAGFRAGYHLFTVTQVLVKKIAKYQEIHLLYIDFQKAYDSIPLEKLWETIQQTNFNANVNKAVKNLYKDITAQVHDILAKNIPIKKRLKQACCLSRVI